jgi:sporulation protein YlmC with PRC-barrel domain
VILRLTDLQRRRVETEDGAAVGRVLDVVIKLDAPDPRIVRIRVRQGRRVLEVDADLVRGLDERPVLADRKAGAKPGRSPIPRRQSPPSVGWRRCAHRSAIADLPHGRIRRRHDAACSRWDENVRKARKGEANLHAHPLRCRRNA